jgi:uncharacterized membrane protein YedE/YeeE
MQHFTPFASLAGGALIGLAASILLLWNGRVAGVIGIFGGMFTSDKSELSWRAAFIGGLIAGGLALYLIAPSVFTIGVDRSLAVVAIAGLLVGFGARMGGGCTSGHGVCGLSRLSKRSLIGTMTFMATGAITVFLVRTLFGGSL